MDSRKSALLADPNGPYDVNVLYLDVSMWAPGPYRVDLLDGFDTEFNPPRMRAAVSRADLDLSVDPPGNVTQGIKVSG